MNKKFILFFVNFVILPFALVFSQTSKELISTRNLISSSSSLTDVSSKNSIPSLSFSSSEAMSNPDYMVTAGDVYSLTYVANATPISYSIAVDSTYRIRVSNLAILDASGKSYFTLKKEVEEIVQKNYPLSGVQFILQNPASFKVVVKGEVIQTTERSVWALTRLSTVIENLTTDFSSIRNVTITSYDKKSKSYDLFKALRNGDLTQDPYLRPGDIITVKKANRLVCIEGAVNRPGNYELLLGENLKELIDYYGDGFSYYADCSKFELVRRKIGGDDGGEKIYLTEQAYQDNFGLISFDKITIFNSNDLLPVIFVEGAVNSVKEQKSNFGINYSTEKNSTKSESSSNLTSNNRIAMHFNEGEDYSFFVRRNKDIFTNVSDLEKAYIIRGTECIPLNLSKILYDSSYDSQVLMQFYDTLLVPFKQFFVSVSGAVYSPGRYPYIPNRTWDYYIGLAGGFVKEKNTNSAIKITDTDGKVHTKDEYILPEMIIEAKCNSGLYYFNQFAPVITTVLSVITTSISIITVANAMK